MPKFSSWRYNRGRVCAPSGDRYITKYSSRYDDSGTLVLEPSGREDLYAFIQASADSCSIENILRRYAAGDVTALNRAQGVCFDATQFPSNFADLLNTVIAAENTFNGLPAEVREKFGNSFASWASTAGAPDWLKNMEKPAEVVDSSSVEVVVNE
ncbi:MAG: internal scaffolding protein [Microviridae sp.]|nr:MAG: internal scaffolding protein [Microviridae sp.]